MEKAYKLEFERKETGGFTVNCCGCSKTEPLHSFGPAIKPHYLIHYVLSGKGSFTIGGKTYPLEAGYGFLIVPEELCFYQADEVDPWTYVWVGFDGNGAEKQLKDIGLTARNPIFHSDFGDELYELVQDMMEHNTSGIANDLRRDGQMSLFLSVIARSQMVSSKQEEGKANHYVRQAVEFIQNNYCYPIKVTDVADYVCINRSYLYTLFKESCGMSPQNFLATFRITKATELLQLTELPVESIAISCGYSDPLVFTKAFHQMKKMSPSKYRKELQSGESRRNKEHLHQIEEFINQVNHMNR